ncbi:MAG: YceI family protein [Candidatus Neomarinimicrobiota bacterium]|nr:YceI family protein [Candidatus Neomarinimicrobiota bacterium]
MIRRYFIPASIILLTLIGCGKKNENKDSKVSTTSSINLEQGSYKIINNESELKWIGKELSTKTHTGTLAFVNGEIDVNSNGAIHGKVQIDMTSIDVTDMQGKWGEKLEAHLKSPDFFGVEKYPNAFIKFHSEGKQIKDSQINLFGELTIKDITHPITFTAELLDIKPSIKAKANLSFDRSKYDVRFRSGKFFENLGDKLILDDINVDVLLVTN